MRMDFNILWVEDQQDRVQSFRERLERLVRGEGFRLQVKFVKSVDEAVASLGDDIYTDHVDLILMDYDLGAGKKGDEGLVEVRHLIPYRDVIFYSSKADELLKMVLERGVEGVFCSTRDDLPDRCFGVFESLIKKVVDIDHSRGIVMGTTSDIDHFVMDALVASFDRCDEDGKAAALAQVQKDLEKMRERFETAAGDIAAVMHLSDLFDHHAFYTSVDRLELLRKVLKTGAPDVHKTSDAALIDYIQKALPRRNDLAHVRVQVNGFSRKLVNRKNIELTAADMKALRLQLLQHHENIEGLYAALKLQQ
jgi:CheY-like chemotaxis protein